MLRRFELLMSPKPRPWISLARQRLGLVLRSLVGFTEVKATCPHCYGYRFNYVLKEAAVFELKNRGGSAAHCVTCVEERLGRTLTVHDFTDDAANVPILFGVAMVEDILLASFQPVRFTTPSVLVSVQDDIVSQFTCDECGQEHKDLPKEGGVVCVCGHIYHNTNGQFYKLTYVNLPTKQS